MLITLFILLSSFVSLQASEIAASQEWIIIGSDGQDQGTYFKSQADDLTEAQKQKIRLNLATRKPGIQSHALANAKQKKLDALRAQQKTVQASKSDKD